MGAENGSLDFGSMAKDLPFFSPVILVQRFSSFPFLASKVIL
jgi:hypothetical protein